MEQLERFNRLERTVTTRGIRWKVARSCHETPPDQLRFAAKLFEWIENFLQIRNKQGKLIPLHFNPVQQILAQYVAFCWDVGIPIKALNPKGRQLGTSTFWTALFEGLCELVPGYRAGLVAHLDWAASTIFGKVRLFSKVLEKRRDWNGPFYERKQNTLHEWQSGSLYQAETIKTGEALGRGDTMQAVHFSESAFFARVAGVDPVKTVTAIMNAVADNEWTIVIHESTADGKDSYYYPLIEDAMNPDSGSTFQVIFLPWFLDSGYSMSWEDYRKQLVLTGKRDPGTHFVPTPDEVTLRRKLANVTVEDHEVYFRYRVELTDEQLIWRRWTITNKCEGKTENFQREYPSFLEEAFTASASCMFDGETVEHYRQESCPAPTRGNMGEIDGRPLFEAAPEGKIHIWKMPEPYADYVLSGDPGGEKTGSDPYASYVINAHSLEVVAMIDGHWEWDVFADTVYLLGLFYNTAKIVIENNTGAAICKRLHRKNYQNLYYYFDEDQVDGPNAGRTPGFNMNKKTRPPLLKKMKRECRFRAFRNPDPGFWREMENFVWVPNKSAINPDREGTYKAVGTNHDDKILAAAMGLWFCESTEQEWNLGDHAKPQEEVSKAYQFYLEEQQREGDRSRALAGPSMSLGVNLGTSRKSVSQLLREAVWRAA